MIEFLVFVWINAYFSLISPGRDDLLVFNSVPINCSREERLAVFSHSNVSIRYKFLVSLKKL